MFRSLFALALSLFMVAEAGAQTTPTTKKTIAKATARQAKRSTKKTARLARKATPAPAPVALTDDGWPPIESVAATGSTAPAQTPAHTRTGYIAYAAPGMAVQVQSGKLVPYSVRPPRKPAPTGTTLTPVAANW